MTSRKTTMPPPGIASSPPMDVLALLPVPSPRGLADTQLHGRSCLWCAYTLNAATAVRLGEDTATDSAGIAFRWFPSSCPRCLLPRIEQATADHRGSCEQCADNAALCPEGDALAALWREAQR